MTTVVEALQDLKGKSIYFEPVGGSNGDVLIEMGTRQLFNELGLAVHNDPEHAEVIVINGSGSTGVELYDATLGGIYQYAQIFRDRPLFLLPSSFYFQGNRLGDCFVNRDAPAFLFARDRYSYAQLRTQKFPPNVQIGLDDDMAFHLRDSDFVRELKQRSTATHLLLVERFDAEAATGGTRQETRAPRLLKQALPPPLKNVIKQVIHRRRAAQTNFTPTVLQRLYRQAPQFQELPVLAQDISSPVGFTFEQYTQAIVDAAAVISTRLHVAILAAFLDKPTYMVSGNAPYPKLRGIYEYSLASQSHVRLW